MSCLCTSFLLSAGKHSLCTVCSNTTRWVGRPFHRTQCRLILVLHPTLLLLQYSHTLVSSALVSSSFSIVLTSLFHFAVVNATCVLYPSICEVEIVIAVDRIAISLK